MIISTFTCRISCSATIAGQINADTLDYARGWNERTASHSDDMNRDDELRNKLGSKPL
jgi:hypothetical protein